MSGEPEVEVRHVGDGEQGAFVVEREGRRVAELTYTREGAGRVSLDHTGVDPALEGRGVGRRLVREAVAWARQSGTKLVPRCSFARAVLSRDASARDVLAG